VAGVSAIVHAASGAARGVLAAGAAAWFSTVHVASLDVAAKTFPAETGILVVALARRDEQEEGGPPRYQACNVTSARGQRSSPAKAMKSPLIGNRLRRCCGGGTGTRTGAGDVKSIVASRRKRSKTKGNPSDASGAEPFMT
jgi:hypothetical protein